VSTLGKLKILLDSGTEYRQTENRLLGFSYDFGVTVIRHQNANNIQNGGRPGAECLS
jgi:hypothetical protein